jgi:Flp pilus assembly protein CpaB
MKTPVRGYAARRKWLALNPYAVTAIVIVATFGGLWVTHVIDPIGWVSGPRTPSRRGQVEIPITSMNVPAYTRITREYLIDAKTQSWAALWVRQKDAPAKAILNRSSIMGRVLKADKPASYAFTEEDFLPEGTRAGLVAGIPPGKRAMRVPVDKVPGLIGLLPGDRFDLVSTLPIDSTGAGGATSLGGSGLYGKQLDLQARLTNWQKQATVRVVVQNGDVVAPMTTRQIPVANTSLTQGLIIRYKPIQEVVIAVAPSEVPRLTEALAVGAEISCVPRSGSPNDPRDSITPESLPVSPYGGTVQPLSARAPVADPSGALPSGIPTNPFGAGFTPIETISGTKREIVPAPVKR